LLTVNKIVKEHGGTLEVESEVNKGSTFRMKFPLKRLEIIRKQANKSKKNEVSYEKNEQNNSGR